MEKLKNLWGNIFISPKVSYREYDNDKIFCWVLDNTIQPHVLLEGTAALIFKNILMKTHLEKFINDFLNEYDIDQSDLLEDIHSFIIEAINKKIFLNINQSSFNHIYYHNKIKIKNKKESNDDLLFKVISDYKEMRKPFKAYLEITYRCNHKCQHCYLGLGLENPPKYPLNNELSTERLIKLMDEMAEEGVMDLVITGGEATLHEDLIDLIKYASSKNFAITLLTNGTHLNEELINVLETSKIYQVRIPLYGNEEEHNHLVGNSTYTKTYNNIMQLSKYNIPLIVTSILTQHNTDSIIALNQKLKKLNINHEISTYIFPTTERDKSPTKFRSSDSSLIDALKILKIDSNKSVCTAGVSKFRITPFGELNPCEMLRYIDLGNLRSTPFNEILASSTRLEWVNKFNDAISKKEELCKSCTLFDKCNDCIGSSYLEHGDFVKKTEEVCRLTHILDSVNKLEV